jgi:hypothetical protein
MVNLMGKSGRRKGLGFEKEPVPEAAKLEFWDSGVAAVTTRSRGRVVSGSVVHDAGDVAVVVDVDLIIEKQRQTGGRNSEKSATYEFSEP